MASYGLTRTGLRVPSVSELLENYQNLMRAEFGHDVDTGADSVWGHLSNIESQRMNASYEILSELYAALSVSGAEGVSLDKMADFSNVKRLPATYSTIEGVLCVGTPGTVIGVGSLASVGVGGDQFETTASATIGLSGVVSVDFQAVDSGAIRANAGTLNTKVSGLGGWTSVVNPNDAQIGSPIESDTDFRIRRARSLRIIGESTFKALAAQMIDPTNGVSGISDLLLVHNPTDTDYRPTGLPPHSFEFTIEDGDSDDIAEKIFELAPAGIWPYSGASGVDKITKTVYDEYNFPHTIEFSRRAETEIWVHVVIEVSDEFNLGNKQSDTVEVTSAVTGDISLTINGITFSYHAVTTGAITSVADGLLTTINVTSPSHGLAVNDLVDITGTVSYNGTGYPVSEVVSSDIFKVAHAFAGSETGAWTKTGGADTDATIAAGLANAVNSGIWVPVTAAYTAGATEFSLQGDFEGCPFVLSLISSNLSRVTEDHVAAAGDQLQIIENIVNYAEGDGTDLGIQGIGADVFLWKYNSPVGDVDNVESVAVYMEDSQPSGDPPTGWGTTTIDIDNRHKALFDSTRVTVKATVAP